MVVQAGLSRRNFRGTKSFAQQFTGDYFFVFVAAFFFGERVAFFVAFFFAAISIGSYLVSTCNREAADSGRSMPS
ncbi:MAG: hypothetical protein IT427_18615 [Pirellulales bacterium]|nr:hypothetical protein [Pirellulales bacterium]